MELGRLASVVTNWALGLANESQQDQRRHGEPASRKIYQHWESPGEEQHRWYEETRHPMFQSGWN